MSLIILDSELAQLPGHKGTITAVDFHPKEPISGFSVTFDLMLEN